MFKFLQSGLGADGMNRRTDWDITKYGGGHAQQ